MRLRLRLALWLLRGLSYTETATVVYGSFDRLDFHSRGWVAGRVVGYLTTEQLKSLFHRVGLILNVAKDGSLDLGRKAEPK